MSETLLTKKNYLSEKRQNKTYNLYRIVLILGLIGGIIAIYFKDISQDLKIVQVSIVFSTILILYVALETSIKYLKSFSAKDNVFLIMNLTIYILLLVLYQENGLLPGLVWLPALLVVSFSSLSKTRFAVFIIIHFITTGYYLFRMPLLEVQFDLGTYISILTTIIILLYITLNLIKLFKEYENELFVDYVKMTDNNLELQELNKFNQTVHEELYKQYERLNAILNVTEDIIIDCELNTGDVSLSEETRGILEKEKIAITNPKAMLAVFLTSKDNQHFQRLWQQVEDGSIDNGTLEVSFKNLFAGVRYARMNVLRYLSGKDASEHIIVVLKDISDKKEQELKIYNMAYYDSLTNMLNRAGFREALQQYIDSINESCCIVLIDVVDFHNINSVYGYEKGDALIRYVAEGLKELKLKTVLMGRVGVDVFAIVISKKEEMTSIMELFKSFQLTFTHLGVSIKIRFKSGISTFPNESLTAEDLMKHSEVALSKAKETNSIDTYLYNSSFSAQVERRIKMMQILEGAVNSQEIYLVYQPKYRAADKGFAGLEALARWETEDFGFVSPAEFVQLAEKSTLIIELDRYIIREVCAFLERIPPLERNFEVSINISGQHLISDDFADNFSQIVSSYDISPSCIGVEITETAIINNFDVAVKHLKSLKDKGFRIHLDDFGTGYSSLSYLNILPVDVLKIDRSFVYYLGNEDDIKKNDDLLSFMINLSKTLGLYSVAEGVEDEAQYMKLKEMGCDSIQGYFFSKPLKEEDALQIYKA